MTSSPTLTVPFSAPMSISPYTLDILNAYHRASILLMAATACAEQMGTEYHRRIHFDAMTVINGAQIFSAGLCDGQRGFAGTCREGFNWVLLWQERYHAR